MKPKIFGMPGLLIVAFLLASSFLYFLTSNRNRQLDKEYVSTLVDELTKSEVRQRNAFTKLESYGAPAFGLILNHLDDSRGLASNDTRLLNISKKAPEKYFSAPSANVNELLLRYLCFRTDWCRADFDPETFAIVSSNFRSRWDSCFNHSSQSAPVDAKKCSFVAPDY